GTLTFTDDATNSPQVVNLTGIGILPVTVPASVSFGSVGVDANGTPKAVTITNNQTTPLSISGIVPTGEFSQSSSTCPLAPQTLAAKSSCSVYIVFSPKATGTRTGTLTFTDNASNSPQITNLSGTGLKPVSLFVTPASASVVQGATQAFTATATYSNGSSAVVTTYATWKSAQTSIATVNSAGVATGSTTISATFFTVGSSASLKVMPGLVAVNVTPANASIALGKTQQFTAT